MTGLDCDTPRHAAEGFIPQLDQGLAQSGFH
jgi:hypothetical protein